MLLITLPTNDAPLTRAVRPPGRIVWQQRYEGIAMVAYRGGKSIAGISGPWSNHYVLTWWEPMPGGQLEIFESLEAAKLAVEQRADDASEQPAVRSGQPQRRAWFAGMRGWWSRRRHVGRTHEAGSIQCIRLAYLRQDTDLSGLSFSACS